LAVHSAAAADLLGVVSQNGVPLPDARVELQGAGSATTDAAGRFLIRNIRPGIYDLRCGRSPAMRVRIRDGLNQINCNG
jgi:hypothetical protein